jgi:hypothetical protein
LRETGNLKLVQRALKHADIVAEAERVIIGFQRIPTHQHLLQMGYIEERPLNIQDLLILVTKAGALYASGPGKAEWPTSAFGGCMTPGPQMTQGVSYFGAYMAKSRSGF